MNIIKTKDTVWYMRDGFEFLLGNVAISKLEFNMAKVSDADLISLYMPKQPLETFWIEDEKHEQDNILYVTRKWVRREDVIWMESL